MTLKQLVEKNSENGTADGIAATAVQLGVNYFMVYRWLKKDKLSRTGAALLKAKGITLR